MKKKKQNETFKTDKPRMIEREKHPPSLLQLNIYIFRCFIQKKIFFFSLRLPFNAFSYSFTSVVS